ncbi:MAG: nuclear transport factor 2 family protein [Steroidobacteraceae bacterium]
MTPLESELAGVLDDLCRRWTALALPTIEELWDPDEAVPYALPQEIRAPVIGWPALRDYWTRGAARLRRASMRWWDLHAKPLGPDLAVALYQMHWNGDIVGFDGLVGIDSRVTAVFRRRGGHWRICHYVEAPAAPMLHLMKYYAQSVDDGFAAATK